MDKILYEVIDDITVIHFHGDTSYDKVKCLIDDLVAKNIYAKRIYDLTAADFDWSLKDLQSMGAYGQSVMKGPNIAAFVATSDLIYGELRQFEAFREDSLTTLKVFRQFDHALAWLKDQK
ncbi:MAG: hypothetical protein V2I33_13595 [Kangiellaceae bacterium]|jgi:hypothetical protein|nr:hypothetical protein [Kangiellaceae bacterium]